MRDVPAYTRIVFLVCPHSCLNIGLLVTVTQTPLHHLAAQPPPSLANERACCSEVRRLLRLSAIRPLGRGFTAPVRSVSSNVAGWSVYIVVSANVNDGDMSFGAIKLFTVRRVLVLLVKLHSEICRYGADVTKRCETCRFVAEKLFAQRKVYLLC